MTEDEVADALTAFYRQTFPHPGRALARDTDLLNEWFVDSFGVIQTVQFLEDTFGIHLARGEINASNFHSIRTLAALVQRKTA